ncbi:MAG: hypothetical protein WBO68_06745, partial [Pyrinomonadaceae bacterium]
PLLRQEGSACFCLRALTPGVWGEMDADGRMGRVGLAVAALGWWISPFLDGSDGRRWEFVGI